MLIWVPSVMSLSPLALTVGLLVAAPALARPPETVPSFHDAVAAAWAQLPQRRAFAARQGVAAAQLAAGGTLFPNAPYATGTYVNDRVLGSNYGFITSEGELGTPIWLPGEGTATQNAARASAATVVADADAIHLALAVQVLGLAAQATFAANERDVAQRRLATAEALAADLAHRLRVGESSQSDALAADAEAAGARVTLSSAEAQLASAVEALAAVTGQGAVPRLAVPAPRVVLAAASATHPRIVAAERAVVAAQAKARLTRIENRDSPTVGVVGINEKQYGSPWDTRFGVVVRFPFATEARNAPLRAAAEEVLTQAEVQLVLARREVLAQIRQAAAVLAGAERGSAAASRAADELDKRRGQVERAWRVGEMPLIEVVRANALAFDAELARGKTRTELDAARQRLRLAEGVLP
jgi:cobalt-zinc-cadmium efflux system outer membrane protein